MVDETPRRKAAQSFTEGGKPLAKIYEDRERFPRIALPDLMAVQEKLQQDAGNQVTVKVRPRGTSLVNGGYILLFDKLISILAHPSGIGARLRSNVLFGFVQEIPIAKEIPAFTADRNYEITEDGKIVCILVRIGCRADITHQKLADKLNVSRSHVTEQVELMRELDIVTNWGRGFTEFDCDSLWRGSMDLRAAYSAVQWLRIHASEPGEDE